MAQPKIGLALGGGGARGLAHIGVLKAFEQNAIPIHCISGTSIGALVGGAYAFAPDSEQVKKRIYELISSEIYDNSGLDLFAKGEPAENFFGQVAKYVRQRVVINLAHRRNSLVSGRRLESVVDFLLPDQNIESAQMPLAVVATDLNRGEDVVFTAGSLRKAALASSSIPGFLPPLKYNGYVLTDGVVTNPVPVQAAFDLGAEIVVAVDVSQELDRIGEELSIIDVMFRGNAITSRSLREMHLQRANFVLRPEVGQTHWADFGEFDALIQTGEVAALEQMGAISSSIKNHGSLWHKMLGWVSSREPKNGEGN